MRGRKQSGVQMQLHLNGETWKLFNQPHYWEGAEFTRDILIGFLTTFEMRWSAFASRS